LGEAEFSEAEVTACASGEKGITLPALDNFATLSAVGGSSILQNLCYATRQRIWAAKPAQPKANTKSINSRATNTSYMDCMQQQKALLYGG